MVIIIICFLLVLGIAFFQVVQGMFNALITAILTILCAAIAFTYYEPLAQLLYSRQPAYADAISLLALFIIPLLLLRLGYDFFLHGNVVLGPWADRIGGGALGLISAEIMVGVVMIAAQMLPFGSSLLTYTAYKDTLLRDQSLAPFYPDDFTLGLVNFLSGKGLSSSPDAIRYDKLHDNLAMECWGTHNQLEKMAKTDSGENTTRRIGRMDCLPTNDNGDPVLKVLGWYEDLPTGNARVPEYLPVKDAIRTVDVRVSVDANTREEGGSWWILPATHFRLVCKDGRSFYPVAYLTYSTKDSKNWELITAKEPSDVARLVLMRPLENNPKALTIDWVFRLPVGAVPDYMVFRRIAAASIGEVTKKEVPTTGALDRISAK